jgi:hypothetical protein
MPTDQKQQEQKAGTLSGPPQWATLLKQMPTDQKQQEQEAGTLSGPPQWATLL